MLPVKPLELKSRTSKSVFHVVRTEISPDMRFLLRSTVRQFLIDGNEPVMEFDERFKVPKVVELISGMEPDT